MNIDFVEFTPVKKINLPLEFITFNLNIARLLQFQGISSTGY